MEDVFKQSMPAEMGYDYIGMSYQEQKARQGLERDVDALSLPAGEHLLLRLANLEVHDGLETEVLQRLLDATVNLLVGVVGREAKLSRVADGLEDRQLGVDDVVLRDVAIDPRSAS